MSGFVKIARKMLDWEWYTDTNVKILFLHLLLKVNWKDSRFQGLSIPRGSLVTSVASLSGETGLTTKQVRTAITKLEKTGEVGKQTASKFTIISITNYASYQDEGNQGASEGQAEGKRRATSKEVKKERREEINTYSANCASLVAEFVDFVSTSFPSLAPKATEAHMAKSCEAVDKLTRIDGFPVELVRETLMWAVRDDFWAKNTLSLVAIRKKGEDGRTKFQKILAAKERDQTPMRPKLMTKRDEQAQDKDNVAISVAARRGIDINAILSSKHGDVTGNQGRTGGQRHQLPSFECVGSSTRKYDRALV